MGYTVLELAEAWSIDRDLARGLVKFLVAIGAATERGKRAPDGGRGRAETIYGFADGYDALLAIYLTTHPLPP